MIVNLMFPSKQPVRTTLSLSGSRQSIEDGWPGNRSEILPHSSRLNMLKTPSPSPQIVFLSF